LLAVEGFVCDPGMVIEAPGSWILLLKSRTSDANNLVIPWKIILVNSMITLEASSLACRKKKCAAFLFLEGSCFWTSLQLPLPL